MAVQYVADDFDGAGSLGGTSPATVSGLAGASWSTYNESFAPTTAFTRGLSGATVVLPLASAARLDFGGSGLLHSASTTIVQAKVRPGVSVRLSFGAIDSSISMTVVPNGSGTWMFDGWFSFGSGSFSGSAISGLTVLRIEVSSTATRFYVDDVLKGTHTAGHSYGSAATSLLIDPLSTFSGGDSAGATVVALRELQLLTEAASGALPGLGSDDPRATIEAPSPLGPAALVGAVGRFARIAVPGPLGAPRIFADHDFSAAVEAMGAVELYTCDLIDGDSITRVPISSWQGTMQLDGASYLQAVVPAVADLAGLIGALSDTAEFVISRCARFPDGFVAAQEMARSVVDQVQLDRGPQRYTCTISGYSAAMAAPDGDGPPIRALNGVRSISMGSGNVRVRCAIDWFLRPGVAAVAGDVALIPSYINWYANGSDAYMDAGERG